MASDGEIGRMTDADGELLIFEVYSDGSAGASDGTAQRFRLETPEQRDGFGQLLNATFLAAEREHPQAYRRPCCDHCNNLAGDPDGHDYGDESAHDGPCAQCADEQAREEAIRDAE